MTEDFLKYINSTNSKYKYLTFIERKNFNDFVIKTMKKITLAFRFSLSVVNSLTIILNWRLLHVECFNFTPTKYSADIVSKGNTSHRSKNIFLKYIFEASQIPRT